MRIHTEEERQAAHETLEKVMEKLQEALRLSHLVEHHTAQAQKAHAARNADAPVK